MVIEQEDIQPEDDSIRSDLEKAFDDAEVKTTEEDIDKDKSEDVLDKPAAKSRDEQGKFAKKSDERLALPPLTADKLAEAPAAWKAADRITEWQAMTPKQREILARREEEVVAGFSKLDEDRNLGKSLKEVINPYMPIIQAEGGTPATAIQSLLNTAYILRTAPVAQKTALFHQLAKQYGVDLQNNTPAASTDQTVQQLQNQIQQLTQEIQRQPQVFAQQQESLVIKNQIDAFAADPKNAHYEKLKPVMASLLQSGQAQDLADAYEKASWADPEIRSAIISEQQKASETQRIAEIKAKADKSRRTAVSIKGSPSINPVANGKNTNSIADDIRAAWDEHAA